MSFPMPKKLELPFWGGIRSIIKRDAMIIKLTADNGLIGFAPGPAHGRAKKEIEGPIRAFLLGKDPLHWKSHQFDAPLPTKKTYHAVEIALLDLAGKYEGCPISALLGGRKRNEIKLYGSAGMYMPPEGYAEEAAAIMDMGFSAYKMRPASGPEADIRTVELMRAACTSTFGLMIDAHSWWRMGERSYDFETVAGLAEEMEHYNATWLEEPLPPEDHESYCRLREKGFVPLASGEHEQDLKGFQDLINKRAVDYIQADVCCQGGFAMGNKIFIETEKAGLKFAFHCWGNLLEVLASAHLGICWPENVVEWLEYPCYAAPGRAGMYPFPLSDEILMDPLPIQNGYLSVPDLPGLGIKINENILTNYPFIDGPWSYFHLTHPKQTIAVTGDHSVKWV